MGLRDKFEDRIKKKKEEIEKFKINILEAEAYIQGLQDAIKYLPRSTKDETSESTIRPGSKIYKTLNLLRSVGKPMHISDILKGIGLPVTKKEKVSLSGSLAWYVRKNEIFKRVEPNTFGLISMESDEPPDNFGLMEEDEDPEKDIQKREIGKNRVISSP